VRPLLIVKSGRTLASLAPRRGDYEDWIAAGMGLARARVRVACVFEDEPLPEPSALCGAVVTGSSAMVSERAAWSERTAAWLARAVEAELPLLGICYGHQLLAHALGGRVERNPLGREIGTVEVSLRDEAACDALFRGLPRRLRVQATHVEAVLELPRGARWLASSERDAHQAFAVGRTAWGVQFHPEFDADVMRSYLVERRAALTREGLDADALIREASDSPDGPALLRRFAALLRPERGEPARG
jgi:GMP synthase (glutamine-hydrolysing)